MNGKSTGFASPAQGYEEQGIDLNRILVRNPASTYFVRMDSNDMAAFGVPHGSLLIVDRSKDACEDSLVMICHQGRFYCRKLVKKDGRVLFTNGTTEIIPIPDETEIVGAITASIQTYDISH